MPQWISNRCPCHKIGHLILLIATLVGAIGAQPGMRVEFGDGVFRLVGWTGGSESPAAGWELVLAVYAGGGQTPMLGTYSVEGNALVFRPRFPLAPYVAYRVVSRGGVFFSDPPRPPPPTTRVEHIYPSADVLPANTLKLYIRFSAPMSAGEAWGHIRLLDETGKALQDSFLDEELWDPEHQRLTVLSDPGRIKRGLAPAIEAGTPIIEGRHYTLAIDREWHDARGVALVEGSRKVFTGGPPVRASSDPKRWQVGVPNAGTSEPLVVHFPVPMDIALLQKMLSVSGIGGRIAIGHDETEWRFTPEAPWKPGSYRLAADRMLEDICGNRLDSPFDRDTRKKISQPAADRLFQYRSTFVRVEDRLLDVAAGWGDFRFRHWPPSDDGVQSIAQIMLCNHAALLADGCIEVIDTSAIRD
jgi:hypothetical protein